MAFPREFFFFASHIWGGGLDLDSHKGLENRGGDVFPWESSGPYVTSLGGRRSMTSDFALPSKKKVC